MDSSDPSAAAVASSISQLRSLVRQHQFAEALQLGRALLTQNPSERDTLLLTAVAERHLGRLAEAFSTLSELQKRHPRFSRMHQERGHCFVARKQAPEAISAFLEAVQLNHALPASWSMLEGLYRMTGQAENLATAAQQVSRLRALPPEVVNATALFLDGDLGPAESMIRAYLVGHGHEVEAMRLLARIGMARQVFDDAELLLSALLQIAPDYKAARAEYAETLIELHRYQDAQRELERLQREDPANDAHYRGLAAAALVGLGEHARAVEMYRSLLAINPADADAHLSVAHALKTMGQRDAAIESYRRAAEIRPAFGDAYWSLANLKTYRFTDVELARLKQLQDDPAAGTNDRFHLHFALGKALEDLQAYETSFQYYARGNALKRQSSNYRAELIEDNTRKQIEVCSASLFARRCGSLAPDPIFIVGLPRAGSTLIEQILASHSQVEGTQELPNIQQIVATLRGREPDFSNPRYPKVLREMSDAEFTALGEKYLADTRIYRSRAGRPFFIDKMPNNFRHLGLIRLILPNARIIDARREPIACCFSNFKQLFAKGQEFTYSVDDIARYYRTYLELMRHWNQVLPGWILKVQHEELVDDLEQQVKRLLSFCGLAFEAQCLEFYKTERSVRTASSEQVRQPIYREGLDQWKHFEPWLGPLKTALGDALSRYRDD